MLDKVQNAMAGLHRAGAPLLVGISGGPDSVAILHALVSLGWRPHVCHLDHRWRGRASAADAEFVRRLARRLGLPATISRRAVPHDEDSARRARQAFFGVISRRTGIETVAVGHTADDLVETLLLRLLRGAGVTGLAGIWPERRLGPLRVIRPLLAVSRTEVLEYLRRHGLAFRDDASNRDCRFLRNRVRHELLPVLERGYNPSIRSTLRRTALLLQDDEVLLRGLARQALGRAADGPAVSAAALAREPVSLQRRALRLWLGEEAGFEQVEAVRKLAISGPPGGEVHLSGHRLVWRQYGVLQQGKPTAPPPVRRRWPLPVPGSVRIAELGVGFRCCRERPGARAAGRQRSPSPGPGLVERFDAGALGRGLFVRTWRRGDRFQPLGMRGGKKLQDIFVDDKVPRRQRRRTPLLCTADGRIAWVVGCRMGELFKVTKATRTILRVQAVALRD